MSHVLVTVVETGIRYTMTLIAGSLSGRSLGLMSDDPIRLAGGLAFGGLALFKHDDGEWRDLFTGTHVKVEPVDLCPNCEMSVRRALVVEEFMYGVAEPRATVTVTVPQFTCDACHLIYTGHEAEAIRSEAVQALLPLVEPAPGWEDRAMERWLAQRSGSPAKKPL